MAVLMVSGVTFAVVYRSLPGADSFTVASVVHERKAADLLAIAFDTPLNEVRCDGSTLAEQWIIRGVNGETSDFSRRKNSTFGEGITTNLILDNLEEYMFLHDEFAGYGSAAASRTFDPEWSETVAKNRLGHVSGMDKLTVEVLGSWDSHLLTVKGTAVEARVTFTDSHVANKWGWTAFPARPNLWEAASNITLEHEEGEPTITIELGEHDIGPLRGAIDLSFKISPLYGAPNATSNLTAGTVLSVHIPPRWTEVEARSELWRNDTPYGSDDIGWTVNFTLLGKSDDAPAVGLRAKPPQLPTYPFDVIELDLSNGSLGHAEVVVKYPSVPEDELPRTVHTTMPYPLVPGAVALFGVSVANGGGQATVSQIDIEIPDGYDLTRLDGEAPQLFADAPFDWVTTAHGGEWKRLSGTHVRWNGTHPIGANDVEEWLVGIPITNDSRQATAVELNNSAGVESFLRFSNGYLHRSTSWGRAPGVLRHIVPPESRPGAGDGYPHGSLDEGTSQEYSYDVWLRRPGVNLTTTGSYVALPDGGDISSVSNALGNARIALPSRKVPLGSVLEVEQNFASLGETLASKGVGGFTITTDLYAPPTLECAPVWSWSRNSSKLPLAGIIDVELFDYFGIGTADVYLIAGDSNVYRVNAAGATTWSEHIPRELGALTDLATGSVGTAGAGLFIGTNGGMILRRDPSGLNLANWSKALAPSAMAAASPAVLEITLDAPNATLLVRTQRTLELRDAATGALRAQRDFASNGLTDTYLIAAEWGPDGYIYATTNHNTLKIDPNDEAMDDVRKVADEDPVGMAATPAGIFVAKNGTSLVYPHSLANAPSTLYHSGSSILRAESGDATGDGIRDLVVVTDALSVEVISGATGTIVATYSASLPTLAEIGAAIGPVFPSTITSYDGHLRLDGMEGRPLQTGCHPGSRYAEVTPCVPVDDPRDITPMITALVSKHGHIVMAYSVADVGRVASWRHADGNSMEWNMEPPGLPSAVDFGQRSLTQRVFLMATDDGKLMIADEDTGNGEPTVEPTSSVGHFFLRVPVPTGGFYGTHVLVTRVGWTDPVRGAQEVALPDWFNVVSADGHPVLAPAYRLHVAVRDPDAGLP